ncbi:caspase family protein [Rhodoblastus sp.]|uniref:caspase family protein n=1 Tax=Rhodoblastus sp. TaxID=1962975 RepID=UPI003F986004
MWIGAEIFGRRLAAGVLIAGAIAAGTAPGAAQTAPGAAPRIALVIGESNYKTDVLPTAANDAGLIADTLRRAGFEVTGAADLDRDDLRETLQEFVDKAADAGPNAVAFVYIGGRGLQYAGDNYIAPVEAMIPRAEDVPREAVRLGDYFQRLAHMPMRQKIVVLDAARTNSFARSGDPLAGGLALAEPEAGELFAFNAAPGAVGPIERGPYGAYALALARALRQPGLPIDQAFDQTRMRVAQETGGASIPWDRSKLIAPPALFARAPGAPRVAAESVTWLRARPIRDYSVDDAFTATLDRDTIQAYRDFLAVYPKAPYSPRMRAILATRREATMWRNACRRNKREAFWTYLHFYPRGPHLYDARRRLADLGASGEPAAGFAVADLGAPPPPTDHELFQRPFVMFDDPGWTPPPPPPAGFLPPPADIAQEAPAAAPHAGLLPLPRGDAPPAGSATEPHEGAIHAPAVVEARTPGAQDYYDQAGPRSGDGCGAPEKLACR